MTKPFLLCIVLLAASGCGADYRWTKPGVGADVAAADQERCRLFAAGEATRRYGGQLDLLQMERGAASTRPVGRSEVSPALQARFEEDRVRRDQDIYRTRVMRDCMESGGYVLTPPTG